MKKFVVAAAITVGSLFGIGHADAFGQCQLLVKTSSYSIGGKCNGNGIFRIVAVTNNGTYRGSWAAVMGGLGKSRVNYPVGSRVAGYWFEFMS